MRGAGVGDIGLDGWEPGGSAGLPWGAVGSVGVPGMLPSPAPPCGGGVAVDGAVDDDGGGGGGAACSPVLLCAHPSPSPLASAKPISFFM
jgi:hypothetical protein